MQNQNNEVTVTIIDSYTNVNQYSIGTVVAEAKTREEAVQKVQAMGVDRYFALALPEAEQFDFGFPATLVRGAETWGKAVRSTEGRKDFVSGVSENGWTRWL